MSNHHGFNRLHRDLFVFRAALQNMDSSSKLLL